MPQQPPAVHDETARLGDGPVPAPPPTGVPAAHAQSARHGQPASPVPADQPAADRKPAEEIPADESPAEEIPADESPAEVTLVGLPEAPAEALPAQEASAADREWDDTRPVSREWMTAGTRDPADDEPAQDAPAEHDAAEPASEDDAGSGDGEARTAGDTVDLDDSGRPAVPGATVADDEAGKGSGGPAGPGTPAAPRRPWWRHPAVIAPAATVAVLGAAYGVDLLLSSGEVPRHTVVAGVDLGGLSPADAATTLDRRLVPRLSAEHTLVADDVTAPLSPAVAGIALDVDATVDAAADQPLAPWTRLTTLFTDRAVDPVLDVDRTALDGRLEEFAGQVDRAPVEATIAFAGTTPSVVQPADGRTLDRDGAADAIIGALTAGTDPAEPVELPVAVAHPSVAADEAQRVLDETVTPALSAPVTLESPDGGTSVAIGAEAIAASLTFAPQGDGSLGVAVDPAALQTALGDELGAFGEPATDATFEVDGDAIHVVPSADGTGVDPVKLAGQLLPALTAPAPRTVTAELGPVPAAFTTAQAQSLGITEQVSSFTTHFTSSASGTNIRVVAEKVDGALVKPGETFSLNTFTGPRGTAQGYVPAAVISGGNLSQAVGGGISQFATTMFNAVFFAGLEDVHHKPHSFYISRYPAGREATVYEGQIDLVWKNDSDTGIYVQTEWVPGSITVTFWGTRHYEIESVSGPKRNVTDPVVQEKVDDGNCTPQGGSQGFDITVTRVFKDPGSGAEIRRENFNTHYAAEAIIRCVPPAEQPAAPSPDGTTPASDPAPGGRRPVPGHRARGRRRP